MRKERKRGLSYSGILHTVLFLLLIVGLPSLFFTKKEPEPMAITVEIVPIGPITNVKSSEEIPLDKPKPEDKKAEAKKAVTAASAASAEPPPAPPEPKPEEKKPEEKKPEPKPVEKPKEEPKPKEDKKQEEKPVEEKNKDKPAPKFKDKVVTDDLTSILKSVKNQAKKEQADKPDKNQETSSSATAKTNVPYDPTIRISQTVQDSIRQQLYKCWSIPAGAKDAEKLIVTIEITLNRDGSLIDAKFTSATRAKMVETFYRAAAESAMRAVKMCSPLKDLPADKYEGWSWMEFNFDPSEMLR